MLLLAERGMGLLMIAFGNLQEMKGKGFFEEREGKIVRIFEKKKNNQSNQNRNTGIREQTHFLISKQHLKANNPHSYIKERMSMQMISTSSNGTAD